MIYDLFSEDKIRMIFEILKKDFYVDFSEYKVNCLSRRINRRMMIVKINSIDDYIYFLQQNAEERKILFDTITINVTKFFRDESTYEFVEKTLLPELARNDQIKIWSAGCSSGEEGFSIAMLLEYYKIVNKLNFRYNIYGSDIDERSLNSANSAVYTVKSVYNISEKYMNILNFFSKRDRSYITINQEIRDRVNFKEENLLNPKWDFKFDMVFCRNVFIYFNRDLQNKILQHIANNMKKNGYLVLGRVETIFTDGKVFFEIISNKDKIYRLKGE